MLRFLPIVRDDGRDSPGRASLHGVEDNEELHEVVVDRRARRLDHKAVSTTHVLSDLNGNLTITEPADRLG